MHEDDDDGGLCLTVSGNSGCTEVVDSVADDTDLTDVAAARAARLWAAAAAAARICPSTPYSKQSVYMYTDRSHVSTFNRVSECE